MLIYDWSLSFNIAPNWSAFYLILGLKVDDFICDLALVSYHTKEIINNNNNINNMGLNLAQGIEGVWKLVCSNIDLSRYIFKNNEHNKTILPGIRVRESSLSNLRNLTRRVLHCKKKNKF
jgi:hypothetical protein